MKLKLNKDGSAVVKDGKPVYVHSSGREEAFDAPAAWKLALGAHFEGSPVMAGLSIPHEIAASAFSDAFRIEGGKLVAVDKHGITMYSPTRHGEAADFNEAFAQLVNAYPNKAMIQREGGALGAGAAAAPGQKPTGSTITRAEFDTLSALGRAKFITEGGRIGEGSTPGASAPAKAATPAAGGKAVMTRAQFDQTPPLARATFIKSGGTVSD